MPIKRKGFLQKPDYSKAFYYDPPSHDFLVWLVSAELMRRYHMAKGPLEVTFGFIDGYLGKYDFGPLSLFGSKAYFGVDKAYSEMMVQNVARPAIDMIGAVEKPPIHYPFDAEQISSFADYDHHIWQLVDAGRLGYEIPKFTPPAWAFAEVETFFQGRNPVVITLRESTVQPERNSNLSAWLKFAKSIEREHTVLFVRDTAKATEPLPFQTWPRASKNAYVRAALYQRSLCNLMVGTGPASWCNFSDAPVLIFKQLVPELPHWEGGQPKGWREQCHLEVGEQLPWYNPSQRLTWTDDTLENIKTSFAEFMERCAVHA